MQLLPFKIREELTRILVNNTPVAYIILDERYQIHFINDFFLNLRKLNRNTTIGECCYNISNAGKKCNNCAVEQALITGQKAFIARKDILPDGSVRFIDDYAIPLRGSPGTENSDKKFVLEIMVNRTEEMIAKERQDYDYDEILSILSQLLEAKDTYTASHSDSVRKISFRLAKAMHLPPQDILDISIAASLHDIGKVRIPHSIINKPAKLTDEEYEIIKQHPVISYEMISDLSSLDDIKHIVRHHHERIDGSGYPDALLGDQISLGAKITAVADTYDAMTSTRSYRKALSHEYALEEIARVAGTQLDVDVVKAFLAMDFGEDAAPSSRDKRDEGSEIIERILSQQTVKTELEPVCAEEFKLHIDEEWLLHEILEHTPCGYVLMDRERNVLYASEYFLEYMSLTKAETLGRKCYMAGGVGDPCPNCAIERALISGKVEYMRQEQQTRSGLKIFDLFGMPIIDDNGKIDYIVEVIIDRTAEVELERQRKNDFKKLINLMSSLLREGDKESEGTSEGATMSRDIIGLRKRLGKLLTSVKRNDKKEPKGNIQPAPMSNAS